MGVVGRVALCAVVLFMLGACGSSRNLRSAAYGRQGNRVYRAPKCNCSYRRGYWRLEDDYVGSRPAVQFQALAMGEAIEIHEE